MLSETVSDASDPLGFPSEGSVIIGSKYSQTNLQMLFRLFLFSKQMKRQLKTSRGPLKKCKLLLVFVEAWLSRCHNSLSAFEDKTSWQLSLHVI